MSGLRDRLKAAKDRPEVNLRSRLRTPCITIERMCCAASWGTNSCPIVEGRRRGSWASFSRITAPERHGLWRTGCGRARGASRGLWTCSAAAFRTASSGCPGRCAPPAPACTAFAPIGDVSEPESHVENDKPGRACAQPRGRSGDAPGGGSARFRRKGLVGRAQLLDRLRAARESENAGACGAAR